MTLILLKLAVAGGIGLALTGLVFLLHSHAEAQAAAGRDDADPDVALPAIITLKNGLVVANFSSPHSFVFDDGSVLGSVSEEVMLLGKLNTVEDECDHWDSPQVDVQLQFVMSEACEAELLRWYERWNENEVNVVIVPFPVLQLLRSNPPKWLAHNGVESSPFRTLRCVDRATKLNSSTKFCV